MLIAQFTNCRQQTAELPTPLTNEQIYDLFEECASMLMKGEPIPLKLTDQPEDSHIIKVTILWVADDKSPSGFTVLSAQRACEHVLAKIEKEENQITPVASKLLIPGR